MSEIKYQIMNTDKIITNLTTIFKKVLEHDNFALIETTTANDIDGWDSITHMMIVEEIEEAYNIRIKLMDLINMNTISDLVKIIHKETDNSN